MPHDCMCHVLIGDMVCARCFGNIVSPQIVLSVVVQLLSPYLGSILNDILSCFNLESVAEVCVSLEITPISYPSSNSIAPRYMKFLQFLALSC